MQQRIFFGILFMAKLCLADYAMLELTITRIDHKLYKDVWYGHEADYISLYSPNQPIVSPEQVDCLKGNGIISLPENAKDAKLKTEDLNTIIIAQYKDCSVPIYGKGYEHTRHLLTIPEKEGLLKLVTEKTRSCTLTLQILAFIKEELLMILTKMAK